MLRALLFTILCGIVFCDTTETESSRLLPTIFVHGAFVGGYSWTGVISRMHGGIKLAPTLAGHPGDATNTPAANVTFEMYVQDIVDLVNQQTHPVMLVGHSFGGSVISQVAEQIPDKIKVLVYLAAHLPINSENLFTAMQNYQTLYGPIEFVSRLNTTDPYLITGDVLNLLLINCPANAASQLLPTPGEPKAAFLSSLNLTDANFGRVPKVYITTGLDLVIPPVLQFQFYSNNTSVRKVYHLSQSGHLPLLCQPEETAERLSKIREKYSKFLYSNDGDDDRDDNNDYDD